MKRFYLIITCILCLTLLLSCSDKSGKKPEASTPEHSQGDFEGLYPPAPVIKNEADRNPDTILDVEEIRYADFVDHENNGDQNYLLIINFRGTGRIYHIYCVDTDIIGVTKGYIECYETEKPTADFFDGAPLTVKKAVKNTFPVGDYYIFNTRFYSLKKTADIEKAGSALKEPGHQVLLISPSTGKFFNGTNAVLGSMVFGNSDKYDDDGLVDFMLTLFEDRGFPDQHF